MYYEIENMYMEVIEAVEGERHRGQSHQEGS